MKHKNQNKTTAVKTSGSFWQGHVVIGQGGMALSLRRVGLD